MIATTTLKLMFISLQGLTVHLEGHKVTVARILIDSIIDRQSLLKTGDVISAQIQNVEIFEKQLSLDVRIP